MKGWPVWEIKKSPFFESALFEQDLMFNSVRALGGCSIFGHAALAAQHLVNSIMHRWHQRLRIGIAPSHRHKLPREAEETIAGPLLLPQSLLYPGPDVLLRIQIWRERWPPRQNLEAELCIRGLGCICMKQRLAI